LPASRNPAASASAWSRAEKLPFIFYFCARRFFLLEGEAIFLRGTAAALRRLAAVQRRFRFLDLCIRFGKISSKVCKCSKYAAEFNNANREFSGKRVRSPSPAFGGAGLASAAASPPLAPKLKRILMLSGEFNFFFFQIMLY